MSEMCRKVSLALYTRRQMGSWTDEDLSRAAIEAMRVPTEEMITAAVEATSEQVDWVSGLFGGSYDNATQVFSDAHTAAIDAALKEQTK